MRLDLGPIFSRAAHLTWGHPILWLYGFLLVVVGGECLRFGGETNLGGNQLDQALREFRRLDASTLRTIALAGVSIILAFWMVSIVLGNWAIGSLLGGLNQAASDGATSLRGSSALGRRAFWPLVAVGCLSGLVASALLLPSLATAVFGYLADQPVFIGAACLWLPVALTLWAAIGLLVTLAQLRIVLAGTGPFEALTSAWRFLTDNLGDLLLVWAVNDLGIGCGAGCVTGFLILAASIPAWIGFAIDPALGVVLLSPSLALSFLVVVGRGVIAVFQRAVWLLSYQELQGHVPPPREEG